MFRWIYHPLVMLAITLGAAAFSFSMYSSNRRANATVQHLQQLEQQVAILEQERATLQARLEYVKQPSFQERIIRDELLMQRPGEKVVFVPLDDSAAGTQNEAETQDAITPWQAWKKLLF